LGHEFVPPYGIVHDVSDSVYTPKYILIKNIVNLLI
jgi:hypothetical protein